MGHNYKEAIPTEKQGTDKHLQMFYIVYAVEHVKRTKSTVYLDKKQVSLYFPCENSSYLQLFEEADGGVRARNVNGTGIVVLRYYHSIGGKKKIKNWHKGLADKLFTYKPEFFESLKDGLRGSKEVFITSTTFFPSAKTWVRDEVFNFFDHCDSVPKIKYGVEPCAFTDLLKRSFSIPNYIRNNDTKVHLVNLDMENKQVDNSFEYAGCLGSDDDGELEA